MSEGVESAMSGMFARNFLFALKKEGNVPNYLKKHENFRKRSEYINFNKKVVDMN